MRNSGRVARHGLREANKKLLVQLDKGIAASTSLHRLYSNSQQVCECIERYVDTLYAIPGGQDELRRRASLVETYCAPSSDYDAVRKKALASYRGQPRKLSSSKVSIEDLRKSIGTTQFLVEIDQERKDIEQVLNDGILNLKPLARQYYEDWRSVCREVQRIAEPLKVDGCWWLYHVHAAAESVPTDHAVYARAISQTNIGSANLESMKEAASALIAWAAEKGAKPNVTSIVDKNRLWFNTSPPPGSRFSHGPVEGTLKNLVRWLKMDRRTLGQNNGKSMWWIKEIHRRKYAIWLDSQNQYAKINQSALAESAPKSIK